MASTKFLFQAVPQVRAASGDLSEYQALVCAFEKFGGLPESYLASIHDVAAVESAQRQASTAQFQHVSDMAHSMGPAALPQIMALLGVGVDEGVAGVQERLEVERDRLITRSVVLRKACLEGDMFMASLKAQRQAALAESEELLRELAVREGPEAAAKEALRLEQILTCTPPLAGTCPEQILAHMRGHQMPPPAAFEYTQPVAQTPSRPMLSEEGLSLQQIMARTPLYRMPPARPARDPQLAPTQPSHRRRVRRGGRQNGRASNGAGTGSGDTANSSALPGSGAARLAFRTAAPAA